MTVPVDVATALYGAVRFARFDAEGANFFEASPRAFWRSFIAAGIVAPFYLMIAALRYPQLDVTVGPVHYLLIESLIFIIGWTLLPVAMLSLAPMFDRAGRYFDFIVAYNWSGVIQSLIFLPIALFNVLGLMSDDAAAFFGLLALSYALFYIGFIARVQLQISVLLATAVVALDFSISIALDILAAGFASAAS